MSLNWKISGIENHEELLRPHPEFPDDPEARDLDPVTKGLIFYTLNSRCFWQLTPGVAAEFYARLKVQEALLGSLVVDGEGKDVPITPENVHRHIGLQTNGGSVSRDQWLKEVVGGHVTDLVRRYRTEFPEDVDPEPPGGDLRAGVKSVVNSLRQIAQELDNVADELHETPDLVEGASSEEPLDVLRRMTWEIDEIKRVTKGMYSIVSEVADAVEYENEEVGAAE